MNERTSFLHTRQRRHRGGEGLAQGHTASVAEFLQVLLSHISRLAAGLLLCSPPLSPFGLHTLHQEAHLNTRTEPMPRLYLCLAGTRKVFPFSTHVHPTTLGPAHVPPPPGNSSDHTCSQPPTGLPCIPAQLIHVSQALAAASVKT